MNKHNQPDNMKRRQLCGAVWMTPAILATNLPAHAQTTTEPEPEPQPIMVSGSDVRICVEQFNNPTDLTGANGSIVLRLTGDIIVSPAGMGDVVVSDFTARILFAEGTEILLHEPPDTGSVTPDANGRASIDGLPLTRFVQEPIVPYINPANGQEFYPAVVTVTGNITYAGVSDSFTSQGSVDAMLDGAGSFTLSSPDTQMC